MGSIYHNADGDGPQEYFSVDFRSELESLFPYLLSPEMINLTTTPVSLTKGEMHTCAYDFNKVAMKVCKLMRCYWWIMMRLNGFTHPSQYSGDRLVETVLVPSPVYFDSLLTQYKTTRTVIV